MTPIRSPIHKGARLQLPSHRIVEILRPLGMDQHNAFECGFVEHGRVVPEGHGLKGRVSLTAQFLRTYGRPA